MKLLFDHNLSIKLLTIFEPEFPNSNHVMHCGLEKSQDVTIWEYAKENQYTIVTKDSDFNDLCLLKGFPPKVIWIRKGNCSTDEITNALQTHLVDIIQFLDDNQAGILTIY